MTTAPETRSAEPKSPASTLRSGSEVEETRLPSWHLFVTGAVSLVIAAVILLIAGQFSVFSAFILGFFVHVVVEYVFSRIKEGPRWATDRVMLLAVVCTFVLALFPLLSLLWEVTVRGAERVWASLVVVLLTLLVLAVIGVAVFFLLRMLHKALAKKNDTARHAAIAGGVIIGLVVLGLLVKPIGMMFRGLINGMVGAETAGFWFTDMLGMMGGMDSGGIGHAILGTGLVTLGATLISVPIGFFTAIFLVEYSSTGWQKSLSRGITFLVDVMTGIPSIVAGLFGLALFGTITGDTGLRMAFMGSVALSVLMIPTVVRTSEEMLRLVPLDLREASYALGVPKWLTIVNVVLRTAVAGLTTAVTLAIARVIGETAPLLLTVGGFYAFNTSFFNGRIETLPTFINDQYRSGRATCNSDTVTNIVTGVEYACDVMVNYNRAWAAALTLIIIVMVLNVIARLVSYFFAPKLGR